MNTVLITGATGNIAGATFSNLDPEQVRIRALIRDESKAENLAQMGVEVLIGDYNQQETLIAALAGVDKVLLITPISLNAVEFAHNLISAAKQAGNAHIVYLSSNTPEPAEETEVGRQRHLIESELIESGLPYTIIRPTFFMQNTMMAAESVAAAGMIYLPFGEGKLGMLDIRDVGEVCARVLSTDGHDGKIYTLTGPQSVSLHDVASALSSTLEKDVTYTNVPLSAAKEAMMGMGMPDWMADLYNELFQNFSQNGCNYTTQDVEEITGHPARSYQQFAQDFAGVFGG